LAGLRGLIAIQAIPVPAGTIRVSYQSLTSSYLAPSKPPQKSKVGSFLASTAKGIYNLVIGDDINTLRDPHASMFSKVTAGVSIASNFIPGEGLAKLGGKLAIEEGNVAYKVLKEPVRAAAKAVAEIASKAVEKVGGWFKSWFGGGGKKVVEEKKLLDRPTAGDNIGSRLRIQGTEEAVVGAAKKIASY
jgi:hypothetical protein